jgi:hypothetical protein
MPVMAKLDRAMTGLGRRRPIRIYFRWYETAAPFNLA